MFKFMQDLSVHYKLLLADFLWASILLSSYGLQRVLDFYIPIGHPKERKYILLVTFFGILTYVILHYSVLYR